MENLTIPVFQKTEPVITNAVLDWCREQYFINSFQNFNLLIGSAFCIWMSIAAFYYGYKNDDKRFLRVSLLGSIIGFWLLISFIIIETIK